MIMAIVEATRRILTSTEMLAAFGGALIGGWLTYLGAIRLQQFTGRQVAKDEFRKIMMPFYVSIKERLKNCPYFLLCDHYTDQLIAYHHFRDSLVWWRRRSFDRAWNEYFGTDGEFPQQYHEHPEDDTYYKNMFELVQRRIERLFEFT